MSQRPPTSGPPPQRQGQAPVETRRPSPPPPREPPTATGGPSVPPPDRGKLQEGLLLLPRFILFLLQVVVYSLGWILFQLGRLLINVSKLREEPTPSMPLPPRQNLNPRNPQRPN